MALIKCNECGKEISDKATHCIHCGCPIQKEEKKYCLECGNELSKNNPECKYCGYKNSFVTNNGPTSFTTYDQYKANKKKNIQKIGTLGKIWLIFSIIVYAINSLMYLVGPIIKVYGFKFYNFSRTISSISFIIELLLLLSYYLLYKEMNKKNFYIIIALNVLMFLFNLIMPGKQTIMTSLSSLLGTIVNILLTYLAVKGCLNDDEIDVKSYIKKYLVTLFLGICVFVTFTNFLN